MNGNSKHAKKRNLILIAITLIIITSALYFIGFPSTKVMAGEDIDISIDHIPANKVECIGKIKLEENSNYVIDIYLESADKVFVALSDSGDIINAQGVEWKQYFEITGKELQHTFTGIELGDFYVYVGNKGGPLEGVKGRI